LFSSSKKQSFPLHGKKPTSTPPIYRSKMTASFHETLWLAVQPLVVFSKKVNTNQCMGKKPTEKHTFKSRRCGYIDRHSIKHLVVRWLDVCLAVHLVIFKKAKLSIALQETEQQSNVAVLKMTASFHGNHRAGCWQDVRLRFSPFLDVVFSTFDSAVLHVAAPTRKYSTTKAPSRLLSTPPRAACGIVPRVRRTTLYHRQEGSTLVKLIPFPPQTP
jgi:hypothetical protein